MAHSSIEPAGTCVNSYDTVTGIEGWWVGKSKSLSQIDQCHTEDFPAGLVAAKYRSSISTDFSQPDEVRIGMKKSNIKVKTVNYMFLLPINHYSTKSFTAFKLDCIYK